MADILIRGMEMPKTCSQCPMCQGYVMCKLNSFAFWNTNNPFDFRNERLAGCPLIELPERGDLVERERVINLINSILEQTYDPEAVHRLRWLRDCAKTMANFALLPRQEETE